MNEKETLSSDNGQTIFEQGITELIHEQFLFAESVYARLPISIEMYDTDGILRFINDHALKMYGVNDRSAVVGTVNLFSSPYMDDQLKARIQSGEENIMLEFEYDFNRINEDEYFTTHNKNSMIFEVQVISLWNKAGNIIGHVLLSNDKTSVKETEFRTEENKKNLEMAMEAANMSSWVYDVRKKTFSSLHGTSIVKEKMTLDDFFDILHPQDCEQLRLVFSQLINKEIENGQITLRFFDEVEKQYRHYESRMRLSSEHMGKLLIIGTQLDITERLQMVKKTQELKEMKEKAELSDRLKSAFLANMSHEIRTPLNAIVGFSGLMVHCDDPAEKEEYMNIIESNNELLLRLINDILDLSKIESGILERKREKFNLSRVCNELYMMIQQKMTNPDVKLFVDNPCSDCWIFLDVNRLKQVWMNFLTNAVKCTHAGFIKMGYSIENEGVRFYVQDSGVGIPVELQDRVFGRFQKLNEFAQGTGLGLAISRAIIEGAGGEIGFTSNPGIGSTFWAWVPCKIDTQEKEEIQEIENAPATPVLVQQIPSLSEINKKDFKVLIAEDNDSNFSLVQHILFKYNLTRVKNGVEALEKLRNEKYDIILMDMKMPIMGGLEAVRKIREFDTKVPIIALTAYAFDSDRTSAMEAGCNAFLTKPLNKSQLLGLFSTKYQ